MSKIQNADVKSLAQLQAAGADSSELINDTKIYVTADGLNKQLSQAILDGDIGGGGVGGINYITNFDAEKDTTGYALFADGATLVDGVGGTATATFARSTVTPLRGEASFLYTPGSVGNGVGYNFEIDLADRAKVLNISIDYSLSATIADGDYQVWIYDRTNNVLIQPAPFRLSGTTGTTYKFTGSFQSASNSSSYRLILFQSAATTATLRFDNVQVGPGATAVVGTVTDWQAYTPTITGLGTGSGTILGRYRRVGDSVEINFDFQKDASAGTGSSVVEISIPSGLTIDSSKITINRFGSVWHTISGITAALQVGVSGNSIGFVPQNSINFLTGSSVGSLQRLRGNLLIPILGWSSSSTISQAESSEGRVVAAHLAKNGTTYLGTGLPINPNQVTFDTTNSYGLVTGKYIVPVSGRYRVSGGVNLSIGATVTGQYVNLGLYRNDVVNQIDTFRTVAGTTDIQMAFDFLVTVNAGDNLWIGVVATNATLGTSAANTTRIMFERLSGNQQVSAAETVSASYNGVPTGTIGNTFNPITFPTKIKDSHGSYSGGVYTIPSAGQFDIAAVCRINATWAGTDGFSIAIFVDGIQISQGSFTSSAAYTGSGQAQTTMLGYPLRAGQQVTVRISTSATSTSFNASIFANHFTINRSGNY